MVLEVEVWCELCDELLIADNWDPHGVHYAELQGIDWYHQHHIQI